MKLKKDKEKIEEKNNDNNQCGFVDQFNNWSFAEEVKTAPKEDFQQTIYSIGDESDITLRENDVSTWIWNIPSENSAVQVNPAENATVQVNSEIQFFEPKTIRIQPCSSGDVTLTKLNDLRCVLENACYDKPFHMDYYEYSSNDPEIEFLKKRVDYLEKVIELMAEALS